MNLYRLENLYTNILELGKNITKNTTIPELKNYKFLIIEITLSTVKTGTTHQKFSFTINLATPFVYNDNYHNLGKYHIQINKNGEVTIIGEAVDKGYVSVNIFGLY